MTFCSCKCYLGASTWRISYLHLSSFRGLYVEALMFSILSVLTVMWLLHGHWLLARLSSWRLNLKLAWHITVADDVVPILSRCSSLATSWLTTLLILIRKPNFIVVISLWFVMHFHHDLFVQILLLQH